MNIEDFNENEIESMEAERKARMDGYNNKEQVKHHGSVEDLSAGEIESMETERKARMDGYNNKEQVKHHGSVEDLSASEIESTEAEIRARRNEVRNIEQNYGSIENQDDAGLRAMQVQVAEQIEQDKPHKAYFNSLANNPKVQSKERFDAAIQRSMQSNRLMREFVSSLRDKISEKTFALKNTDKEDKENIQKLKSEIEDTVAIYQKYLYSLKDNRWDFSNLHEMTIPEDVKEDLWQQQKRLDITFEMPVPANMGKEYGEKFERSCRMVPGLQFMYDDLSGKKEVNWHQVVIYKENELTPRQAFIKRQLAKIEAQREELARKRGELTDLEKQQGGNVYGE